MTNTFDIILIGIVIIIAYNIFYDVNRNKNDIAEYIIHKDFEEDNVIKNEKEIKKSTNVVVNRVDNKLEKDRIGGERDNNNLLSYVNFKNNINKIGDTGMNKLGVRDKLNNNEGKSIKEIYDDLTKGVSLYTKHGEFDNTVKLKANLGNSLSNNIYHYTDENIMNGGKITENLIGYNPYDSELRAL